MNGRGARHGGPSEHMKKEGKVSDKLDWTFFAAYAHALRNYVFFDRNGHDASLQWAFLLTYTML